MPFLVWLLLAQATAPKDVKPEDRGSIEGQVIHALTGAPVRKAEVVLDGEGEYGAVTVTADAAGRFVADQLAPVAYSVTANAAGYIQSDSIRVQLPAKGNKTGVVIKINPHAVITGRVLDEDGDPVSGVTVTATHAHLRRRGRTDGAESRTNDLGEYRLSGLRPGRYLLHAEAVKHVFVHGADPSAGARRPVALPTYFPGTVNVASAQPIKVAAGNEIRGSDIRLQSARGVRVLGRVEADVPLKSIPSVTVRLSRGVAEQWNHTQYNARTKDDGTFEFQAIPPGDYVLSAEVTLREGGEAEAKYVELSFHERMNVGSSDIRDVVVTPRRPAELQARVAVETGGVPLEKVTIRFSVHENDALSQRQRYGDDFRAGKDGWLLKAKLRRSLFRLSVGDSPEPDVYLKSASVDGRDVLRDGFDSSVAGELSIVLARDGGTVQCTVPTDEKDKRGWLVFAWPADGPLQPHRRIRCYPEKQGACTLKGMPPGEYKVAAIAGSWQELDLADDPAFLRDAATKSDTITVAAGGQLSVTVKPLPVDVE